MAAKTLTEDEREGLIEAIQNGDEVEFVERILTARLADRDAAGVEARAAALEAVADDLTWVRPEVCPCPSPEACCGCEASCDAMQPLTLAIDADGLRQRAAALRAALSRAGDDDTTTGPA